MGTLCIYMSQKKKHNFLFFFYLIWKRITTFTFPPTTTGRVVLGRCVKAHIFHPTLLFLKIFTTAVPLLEFLLLLFSLISVCNVADVWAATSSYVLIKVFQWVLAQISSCIISSTDAAFLRISSSLSVCFRFPFWVVASCMFWMHGPETQTSPVTK